MTKKNDSQAIEWVAFNSELLNCLRQKDNHKFSRYDAFLWLIEHIREGHVYLDKNGIRTQRQEYSATYIRLADDWHWTRQPVQKFIEELSSISIISQTKSGNTFIFSLNCTSADKIIL